MQRAGAFRMTMPRALGGLEADPVTPYEVIEALSAAEGAAGWVAMIESDAGYLAGRIDEAEVTRSMYELAGSGARYRPHPLERAFRDATVAANHLLVREGGYAEVGRVSPGMDPKSLVLAG
jgi:alkylation response protein AidB-like acyl-CoA dehydrogenase